MTKVRMLEAADTLQALWKKKIWILLAGVAGLGLGYGLYALVPARYTAKTLILVEAPKVPDNYVRTTVTTSMRERIQTIQQQMMNRENLERIVDDLNLFPDLRSQGRIEKAVMLTRKGLSVMVQGNRVFQVEFEANEPDLAAEVANRIADLFIRENLQIREDQVLSTQQFLESELKDLRQDLEEQEAKVALFQSRNQGQLPGQKESIMAALQQIERKLEVNRDDIDKAELEKLLLEQTLTTGALTETEARPLSKRVADLRAQLRDLESQYTDRHPDVIRLHRELELLEQDLREPAQEQEAQTSPLEDPVKREQLAAIERDLQDLIGRRERLFAEQGVYQNRLAAIPRIEQEEASLTRDYDNLRKRYESLLSKRLDAQLAARLEKQQQSEQFRILERAVPPGKASWPMIELFLAAGLALGLLSGGGLAILRELTSQTYKTVDELLKDFPGVRILAPIPQIDLRKDAGADSTGPRRQAV